LRKLSTLDEARKKATLELGKDWSITFAIGVTVGVALAMAQ